MTSKSILELIETSSVDENDYLVIEKPQGTRRIKATEMRGLQGPAGPQGPAGSSGGATTILNNYQGSTMTEKMKAMIADITTNHKNDSMTILLPDGITEITEDIVISEWTNKTIICRGALWFNGCNAIEFKKIQHCDISLNRVASNAQGLIGITNVKNLNKRGLKVTDSSYNRFSINQIVGFTNAIELYSEYGAWGTFYNDFFLNAIWRSKLGIKLYQGSAPDNTSSISGWVNENTFYSGMVDCNKGIQIGQPLAERPANEPQDNYHNNKFYGFGFEQLRDESDPVAIDMIQGFNNVFLYPRFEPGGYGGRPYIAIREGKDAYRNVYHTSGYPLEVSRIQLNTSAKKNNGTNCQCQSYLIANFTNQSAPIGDKMIALQNKIVMEATALSNYYLNDWALPNTFCYAYEDTIFAKYKDSQGVVKTMRWS